MTLNTKSLSLEMAKTITAACEEKARELNFNIAVAVMDNHGNLKYFSRMDGNNFISVRMSQLKAMTSASIPISTKALAERNKSFENSPYSSVPGIVLLEGGLPILTKDDQHIGSIGISGANPEIDGICAQAGLEAIQQYL